MTSQDDREQERDLKALLERLRQEHRDLDAAIEALTAVAGSDVLQVQRLKKRKLQLKDRISQVEDELFPDIIA
ncbi:YdcH family protein [Xanthobacter pseudotagetidis]|uniref:YdcH family protein n=1 Tax=Xanthobacter pseudotagetidis TaxID=3119911 RepID=UPI00372BC498